MASNQYGPAASYQTPARLPQSYQRSENYSPSRHNQTQNYKPIPNQWDATNYSSPYRDNEPSSPDLHPGMGGPNYDSSSSRSQGSYGQYSSNNSQFGPSAPSRGAEDIFNNGRPNAGKYAGAAGYTPDNRSRDFVEQQGSFSSPRGPYQNSPFNQSSHASYNSADQLTMSAAPAPTSHMHRGNGYGYINSGNNYAPNAHPYRNPYDNHSISRTNFNGLEHIDPNNVADDGDDGLGYRQAKRRSVISLHRQSKGSTSALGAGAVTGLAGATAGAGTGTGSGFASKNTSGGELDRGIYGEHIAPVGMAEKSPAVFAASLKEDEAKRRKCKKISFIILGVVILCAIVGGVVAAVLISKKNDDNRSGSSSAAAAAVSEAGSLDKNSAAVKKLLNNKNLHKVFTGMAYTPLHSQYPDCVATPPIQNNVTLDMAILSQVTNTLRLYGTDCNQTEMVLTAIDKLGLTDMKVWIGVWLNSNSTTNNRQISQLWSILDQFGTKNVKGIAVGNEVLFRKDLTNTQLKNVITGVRNNLTSRNINLPVATSDLGDNWTTELASAVDVIMSNVHPFFGGVQVDQAASWTWTFWQTHDVALTSGMANKQHIISEVGWPTQGGKDCGGSSTCGDSTPGAVAGIKELNTFMNTWVCQALTNQTEYFWFELLDEPWKIVYNTAGRDWEDHWGLFDVNRNLKPGVVIPSCGGQSVKAGGYP